MRRYRRVTYEDRIVIRMLLEQENSKSVIAKQLGFNKSTIGREIARNSDESYSAKSANLRAKERFKRCRKKPKLNSEIIEFIRRRIEDHWSPEQICGRLKLESKSNISHETIYRFIRKEKESGGSLWKFLRRPPRRGNGRHITRTRKPDWFLRIKERPQAINERSRLGDWERDMMLAFERKPVLVIVDRKSRFLKLDPVLNMQAYHVGHKTVELLGGLKTQSITNDNGPEFRDHYLHHCPIYYCDPNKPQQRGTIENTIGLLRQFIDRKTDISNLKAEDFRKLEDKMNQRPRKCLDYKTPAEVYNGSRVALVN